MNFLKVSEINSLFLPNHALCQTLISNFLYFLGVFKKNPPPAEETNPPTSSESEPSTATDSPSPTSTSAPTPTSTNDQPQTTSPDSP